MEPKDSLGKYAIFALLLALLVAFLTSRSPQKSVFNDSDLMPLKMAVPVESNAFSVLLKATNELYWPKSFERKVDDLSDNTNWDDPR